MQVESSFSFFSYIISNHNLYLLKESTFLFFFWVWTPQMTIINHCCQPWWLKSHPSPPSNIVSYLLSSLFSELLFLAKLCYSKYLGFCIWLLFWQEQDKYAHTFMCLHKDTHWHILCQIQLVDQSGLVEVSTYGCTWHMYILVLFSSLQTC